MSWTISLMNYVTHLLRIKLDGIELATAIRKYSSLLTSIYATNSTSVLICFWPHIISPRFQAQLHGMILSPSEVSHYMICVSQLLNQRQSKRMLNWFYQKNQTSLFALLLFLCVARIYIGIFLYPEQISFFFHLDPVHHYRIIAQLAPVSFYTSIPHKRRQLRWGGVHASITSMFA